MFSPKNSKVKIMVVTHLCLGVCWWWLCCGEKIKHTYYIRFEVPPPTFTSLIYPDPFRTACTYRPKSADVNTDSRSLVTPSGLLWIRRYHSYSLELKAALNFSLDTFFLLISSSSLPCNFSFFCSLPNPHPFFVHPH